MRSDDWHVTRRLRIDRKSHGRRQDEPRRRARVTEDRRDYDHARASSRSGQGGCKKTAQCPDSVRRTEGTPGSNSAAFAGSPGTRRPESTASTASGGARGILRRRIASLAPRPFLAYARTARRRGEGTGRTLPIPSRGSLGVPLSLRFGTTRPRARFLLPISLGRGATFLPSAADSATAGVRTPGDKPVAPPLKPIR